MSSFRPTLGPPGAYIFPLGKAALYSATLFLSELSSTLVSNAASTKLCCIQLSYAGPKELRCTL